MLPPRHLALGNINIDVYLYVDRLPAPDEELPVDDAMIGPGGAASNYAVAAARAGHVSFLVAHTTRDAVALGILERLRSNGVNADKVVIHEEGVPGMVVVVVTRNGETVMFKVRGVNALLRGDEAPGEYDVVHVASAEPDVIETAMSVTGARLYSYDPGGAVALRQPSRVASLAGKVTLLTLNAREFLHVFGLSVARLIAQLPPNSMILVRLGARGSMLIASEGVYYTRSCRLGEPVDTTGAGDAFNAYFNAWLVEGKSVEDALIAATTAAGLKVLRRGAQSAPSRAEVEEAMRKCEGLMTRVESMEAESLLREAVSA